MATPRCALRMPFGLLVGARREEQHSCVAWAHRLRRRVNQFARLIVTTGKEGVPRIDAGWRIADRCEMAEKRESGGLQRAAAGPADLGRQLR